MEWSLSKVMRIEKGQVNISPSDLRSVLAMLDITDQTEIDDLLADVRVSRSERYSNSEYDREHLSPATVQLLQYEEQATAILHYNNVAIPGELQTIGCGLARASGEWPEASNAGNNAIR